MKIVIYSFLILLFFSWSCSNQSSNIEKLSVKNKQVFLDSIEANYNRNYTCIHPAYWIYNQISEFSIDSTLIYNNNDVEVYFLGIDQEDAVSIYINNKSSLSARNEIFTFNSKLENSRTRLLRLLDFCQKNNISLELRDYLIKLICVEFTPEGCELVRVMPWQVLSMRNIYEITDKHYLLDVEKNQEHKQLLLEHAYPHDSNFYNSDQKDHFYQSMLVFFGRMSKKRIDNFFHAIDYKKIKLSKNPYLSSLSKFDRKVYLKIPEFELTIIENNRIIYQELWSGVDSLETNLYTFHHNYRL